MTAARLLDRLDRVRQVGPGRWIAACPAHDDRSPSLSVRELDDGRILVHDFGGCDTQLVLGAVGLSLSDLFPGKLDHNFKPSRSRVPLRDLATFIDHEAMIIALIGADILTNKKIEAEDYERLATAVRRIGEARDHVHP